MAVSDFGGGKFDVSFLIWNRMTTSTTTTTTITTTAPTATGQCKTTNGVPCVFPFTYNGKKYHACKTWWESKGSSWCATKTENGKYLGIWGWCNKDCSKPKGK